MINALNVDKKRLGIIGGIGGTGLLALVLTLFLTGSVFAAFPISGVGGFIVAADSIKGTDFKLYPQLGPTENKNPWGNAAVDLGTATIDGLVLSKNIDLGGALAAYDIESVEVAVTANGSVQGDNLKLRVTGIDAGNAQFSNLKVQEYHTDNPLNVIDLQAPTLDLTNAKLNTHFLQAGSIGIPGLKVKLIHNKTDGTKIGDF